MEGGERSRVEREQKDAQEHAKKAAGKLQEPRKDEDLPEEGAEPTATAGRPSETHNEKWAGYRPIHRPIVVDISPEKVEVVRTEIRHEKESLTDLMAGLESAERARGEIQALQFQGIMQGMAEYLCKSTDELAQEYVRRGLRSDPVLAFRGETFQAAFAGEGP
jgi:hypothetical protein